VQALYAVHVAPPALVAYLPAIGGQFDTVHPFQLFPPLVV
jgi:hypothetical protein